MIERAQSKPAAWRVAGCDEPPAPLFIWGVEQFNAGAYWECHETLEGLWRQEARPVRDLYQGLLQIGVGFYHARRGNRRGAVKVLQRGLQRLYALPEVCQGIHVAELRCAAQIIHDRLAAGEPVGGIEFDECALPRVRMADGPCRNRAQV